MRRNFVILLAVFLLAGCSNQANKELSTDDIFKEELKLVSKIDDAEGKKLLEDVETDRVQAIFDNLFSSESFERNNISYHEVSQGISPDGKGGVTFCTKLPVSVEFVGNRESVGEFLRELEGLDNAISFGKFDIENLENGKYKVTTLVDFLGYIKNEEIFANNKGYTISRKEVKTEKDEEISLRNFDVSMIIRPSNSDAASVSLGVIGDKDYRVYSDDNDKMEVKVVFSNEGSKYFCEYKIAEGSFTKAQIKPNGNILFDILSCEIAENDDDILIDLYISNNSNKKVSVVTYDDKDKRVNIADKSGNIEVSNK